MSEQPRCRIFACVYNDDKDLCCHACKRRAGCDAQCRNHPGRCGALLPEDYNDILLEMRDGRLAYNRIREGYP